MWRAPASIMKLQLIWMATCFAVAAAMPAPADKSFMETAGEIGMAEVKLGQLAEKHTQNPEVRRLAAMMVKDHTAANSDMKKLAAKKKVTLPKELSAKHKSLADKLESDKSGDVDQEYTRAMVEGHSEAVELFDETAKSTTDEEVRALCEKMLPILRHHLEEATKVDNLIRTGRATH